MTLEQIVNAELASALDGDKIKLLVEEHARIMIEKSIKEMFSTYGTIGKQIQDGIKNAVKIDFNHISLPEYNAILGNNIRRTVEEELNRVGLSRVNEDIKKMISESVPLEISLEDIVAEYKDSIIQDYLNDDKEGEIELEKKTDGSFTWIYLNPNKIERTFGRSEIGHLCQTKIYIYKGELSAIHSNNMDFSKRNFVGSLSGFEAYLFKLYAARTRITGLDSIGQIDLAWAKEEDEE